MGVLEDLKYLNYKRKNLFKIYDRFKSDFLMANSKKVRRPINNSDHWTSKFFKFRGTLTAPEQTYGILDWIYQNVFSTQQKFESTFKDRTLWQFVGVVAYLSTAVFLSSKIEVNKNKKKR